jgi:hypothetical protein
VLSDLSPLVPCHLGQTGVIPVSLIFEFHHDPFKLDAEAVDYCGHLLDLISVSFNRVFHLLYFFIEDFVMSFVLGLEFDELSLDHSIYDCNLLLRQLYHGLLDHFGDLLFDVFFGQNIAESTALAFPSCTARHRLESHSNSRA